MELRKDYILDNWVIISENRGKRPNDFVNSDEIKKAFCVFCKGNENQTPPELYRVEKEGKWMARVIPNKFSAVDPNANSIIQTHNNFYTFGADRGEHEVIIETPEHGKNFGDLSVEEIMEIIKIYSLRVNRMLEDVSVKYACLFKNQGKEAGASINHPHSQLISLSIMPPLVEQKLEAINKYSYCPYCDVINREKDSYRRCFENDTFIAFAPYASRFNYEIWILPKKHILTFEDIDDKMRGDLASMLKIISLKLEKENIDFDFAWYYSPYGKNLHFHIEVLPRIAKWAGFEIGFGITINTISPESAAKFYRGEI